MTSTPTIALVGPMAVGKSHIARELARLAHLPHCDLDKEIEKCVGQSIPALFASRGEAEFRRLESEVLFDRLKQRGIIATGGGVVLLKKNRAMLREPFVVYLRARAETLAARIRLQPGTRPLIDGESTLDFRRTLERVQTILAARSAHYEEVADLIIDTDEREPRAVAHQIWTQFQLWRPSFSTEL